MPPDQARPHILVVDDDESIRRTLRRTLREFDASFCCDGAEAINRLCGDVAFDAVVTDLDMPRKDGFEVVACVRKRRPKCPVVVMTGQGSISQCVAAMRAGAADFIAKPFRPDAMLAALAGVLADNQTKTTIGEKEVASPARPQVNLLGERLNGVLETVERVAAHDATVLITGESGTGKEVVARLIHSLSPRALHPYVAINCGAIPEHLIESELFGHARGAFTGATERREGRFAQAEQGTLFLDEIGDLPLQLQVKLVRVLQEREYSAVGDSKTIKANVRIVAATLQELEKMVAERRFRQDLYYRLNVVPVELPPLRECPDDITTLARYFTQEVGRKLGRELSLSSGALALFRAHSWPGNVRELENMIERLGLVTPGEIIQVEHLPKSLREQTSALVLSAAERMNTAIDEDGVDLPNVLAEFEQKIIAEALSLAKGNRTKAAQLLNIKRTTLLEKMRRFELHGPP